MVIHFQGEIGSLHHCKLEFYVSKNVEIIMVLYFHFPNMASESATFDRQDKILELKLTGAQENIQSLLLKHSTYDHNIPTSSLGLKCWQEAMDLRYISVIQVAFLFVYVNTCF
jgi:hypothetical protein